MLTAPLPAALEQAISERVGSGASRARAGEALSRRYRGGAESGPVAVSEEDVLGYAAARLPATYAAMRVVLGELAARAPAFAPASQLDLGSGPGTALAAAGDVWRSIRHRVAVEAEPAMAALGRGLAPDAEWIQATLPAGVPDARFDLVTIGYVLGELPAEQLGATVERAWAATAGALAIVEPGTPAGTERVLAARGQLLGLGASLVAPCPHERPCPLAGTADWCHFAVRVARSGAHRAAKRAALGHEDEKFAYVVVARTPAPRAAARVLRHPQVRSGHVLLELCTPDGVRRETVSRRDRDRYRRARDVSWGEDLGA